MRESLEAIGRGTAFELDFQRINWIMGGGSTPITAQLRQNRIREALAGASFKLEKT